MINKNKIIIYSFVSLSRQIAKVLYARNYEVIIVDTNELALQEASQLGYKTENISLLDDDNIIALGLDKNNIKAFFCLGEDKNTNLFITLSVRSVNKELTIISLSSSAQDNKTMLLAGASKTINPYEIGALRIFRLLHKPLILEVLDHILFSNNDIQIEEMLIEKDSVFNGAYLEDLKRINSHEVIILGIQDKELGDKFIFSSSGYNHKIDYGDTLVLLGCSKKLATFRTQVNELI